MQKKVFTGILIMQVVAILTVFGYLCYQEPKIRAARKAVSDVQAMLSAQKKSLVVYGNTREGNSK